MGLLVAEPKRFAPGQSVTWLCETSSGSIVPMQARVVNVVNERVVIRVVKHGAVYFKVVRSEQVRNTSPSEDCMAA